MKIVDYTAGHYEVQDVEFGKVYAWRPESVVAECECGEKLHLTVLEAKRLPAGGAAQTMQPSSKKKSWLATFRRRTRTLGATPGIEKMPGYLSEGRDET